MGAIGHALGYHTEDLSNFAPTNRPHEPWILYADPEEPDNGMNVLAAGGFCLPAFSSFRGIHGADEYDAEEHPTEVRKHPTGFIDSRELYKWNKKLRKLRHRRKRELAQKEGQNT